MHFLKTDVSPEGTVSFNDAMLSVALQMSYFAGRRGKKKKSLRLFYSFVVHNFLPRSQWILYR